MDVYTFTQEELTKELNKGREIYLDALQKEGIISKEDVDEMSKFAIVIASKTVLGSIWDKFFTKNKNPRYFVVRVLEQWRTDE